MELFAEVVEDSFPVTTPLLMHSDVLPNPSPLAQELSMWRTKKAEESLKNSVLDEEAAARFSTAAALAAGSGRSAEQANLLATREPSPEAVSGVAACELEQRQSPTTGCRAAHLRHPCVCCYD